MRQIEFTVRGMKGDLYTCTFQRDGDNLNAFCTCPDGHAGNYCKHRIALLDGNQTIVVSNNAKQVDDLPEMVSGTDVETALVVLSEAIQVFQQAEASLVEAQRGLARAMRK